MDQEKMYEQFKLQWMLDNDFGFHEKTIIRLKDMLQIIDGSISKLLIKGDTQAHNRIFDESNISTMSARFRQDRIECFDVVKNKHGEKVLVVKLANWK